MDGPEDWLKLMRIRHEGRTHGANESGRSCGFDVPPAGALSDFDLLTQKCNEYHENKLSPPVSLYRLAVRLLDELRCEGDAYKMRMYIKYQYNPVRWNPGPAPKVCRCQRRLPCSVLSANPRQVITNFITTMQAAIDIKQYPKRFYELPTIFGITTLELGDDVKATALNGVRDMCVHGEDLRNRVLQVYSCADTYVRSQKPKDESLLQQPRALGIGQKKHFLVVSGALHKSQEMNEKIYSFWGQKELHFANTPGSTDPSVERLPGRGLKIIHKSDFELFQRLYLSLGFKVNYAIEPGFLVQVVQHDTLAGHVGEILAVRGEMCIVGFDCDSSNVIIKLPLDHVVEFLPPGSEVLVTGVNDLYLNFKYATVVDYDFNTALYSIEVDFLQETRQLPRKNLYIRSGLVLLGDKDHLVMRKCPNSGVMTAYVFFPLDEEPRSKRIAKRGKKR